MLLSGDFACDVPLFVEKGAVSANSGIAEIKTSMVFFRGGWGWDATWRGHSRFPSASRFEKVSD